MHGGDDGEKQDTVVLVRVQCLPYLARLKLLKLEMSGATNVDEFSKSWDLCLTNHTQPGDLKSTLSTSVSFLHPPPLFASSCHNVELATQVLKNQSMPHHELASCRS